MARSYIKLYGPSLGKAFRALENVAVAMSEKTEMRFYSVSAPTLSDVSSAPWFLPGISRDEKVKLISHSTRMLGDYDFFFEWGIEPTLTQVLELIEKIDEALADCGCMYTITTK